MASCPTVLEPQAVRARPGVGEGHGAGCFGRCAADVVLANGLKARPGTTVVGSARCHSKGTDGLAPSDDMRALSDSCWCGC